MNNVYTEANEQAKTPNRLTAWLDEHPTGALLLSALGSAGIAWLSIKGVELKTSIDVSTPTEFIIPTAFMGVGSAVCAHGLTKLAN